MSASFPQRKNTKNIAFFEVTTMKAFKKKNGIESRLAQAGIRMVLPSMLIIAVFTIYPIFQSLIMSFTNWNILKNTRKFVGLNNCLLYTSPSPRDCS